MPPDFTAADEPRRATAWLAKGIESLVAQRPWMADVSARPMAPDFDVVIVGSGYGGAVAAAELAGCLGADGKTLSVCVLERGKEYLQGMFPSRMADLAGHVRFASTDSNVPRGVRDGLFDVRLGDDAVALVANGLGGGSLINAGVMVMPLPTVFREPRWPQAIRNDTTLPAIGNALLTRLGARPVTDLPAKAVAMHSLGYPRQVAMPPITVAALRGVNSAGVVLDKCIGCGDCGTGCNHNAKESLDVTLLRSAVVAGAKIFTGATVLRLQRDIANAQNWVLVLNHTDGHLRDRQPVPFRLRARRVILAAGTLGSTEILMRSRSSDMRFSHQLGCKFSANGDMIAVAHAVSPLVNAVANEESDPASRNIGPTITTMIDCRSDDPETSIVIQDLAIPGPLRRLYEESVTSADVLRRLVDGDCRSHDGRRLVPDDAQVDAAATKRSLVVAMIGRDTADGELQWGGDTPDDNSDGLLTVHWPALRQDPRLAAHHVRLGSMLTEAQLGGRVIDNPMWRPLSEKLEGLFGKQRGPLLTVHPLGGCAMGDDVKSGVTNDLGQVYDASAGSPVAVHEGLSVLDGSIIPSSLGINPALTIATLAQRAISALKVQWHCSSRVNPVHRPVDEPVHRPLFRRIEINPVPTATAVELTEQLRSKQTLRLRHSDGNFVDYWVEITLTTQPVELHRLMGQTGPHRLDVCAEKGRIRLLRNPPDPVTDRFGAGFPNSASGSVTKEDAPIEFELEGAIHLFALEKSWPLTRVTRVFFAWVLNRGLRDIAQSFGKWLRPGPAEPERGGTALQRIANYVVDTARLLSRAGAVRLLEYEFKLGEQISKGKTPFAHWVKCAPVLGVKRLTYARCASPWTQLMELELTSLPDLALSNGPRPSLALNPRYLARQQVPLLRIVQQQDHVAALIDVASFVLYLARMVLQVHALSLRRPDAPYTGPARRLPGKTPGLPAPCIEWLTVASSKEGPPARIRLARYYDRSRAQALGTEANRPVLLIHGYSASGTTYAHSAVPKGLAHTLCEAGRDVWVLDMRSSAGMPTARGNWALEEMAIYDIPCAVEHVKAKTNAARVDVFAHCMGAAMFSMAVLSDRDLRLPQDNNNHWNRLHKSIGRVVFSQVAPAVVLSPSNLLRAYMMRYVRQYLPIEDYAFSPEGEVSLTGQLLDRVLATMPLPPDEYKRENPWWPPGQVTPWVGTRHRMDALYGRDFSLCNLSDDVLEHIDDFFGPLSVQTVSQVIHFARHKVVTNHKGVNDYFHPERIKHKLRFPIFSIHGEDNGLADVATLEHMRRKMEELGVPYLNDGENPTANSQTAAEMHALINSKRGELINGKLSYLTWRIANHGHQDTLIGVHAAENCGVVANFLAEESVPRSPS